MTTFKELKKELKPYKNTLVIGHFNEVVRLVGVNEDEDDYYWIYDSKEGKSYESCVGGWVALKGVIPDEDYERLLRVWNLNNIEKAI